jgi:Ulp1 family protease
VPIFHDNTPIEKVQVPAIQSQEKLPAEKKIVNELGASVAIVSAADLERLLGPTRWLNDECINALMALLQRRLNHPSNPRQSCAQRCAIFSTFTFAYPRHNLWKIIQHTGCWEKDVWIVPIHRRTDKHWVAAAVLPYQRQILLFDSFAERGGWERDLPVSVHCRLNSLG